MLTLAASDDMMVPITAMVLCFILVIVTTVTKAVRRNNEVKAREQTRREIAAYIAEGSMTPEQGERLMKAGERPDKP